MNSDNSREKNLFGKIVFEIIFLDNIKRIDYFNKIIFI